MLLGEVNMKDIIDITFDFRSDSNGGDPDSKSPTLRSYHKLLWSKELPCGGKLILNEKLNNTSDAGDFYFGSDSIIHSFSRWESYKYIIDKIRIEEKEEFRYLGYTMGGMIIFPRNKINNLQSINMARGCNQKIKDRFDLTLECIRRYYNKEDSPLNKCFRRYSDFFDLFVSFKGYVDFFLLQDLVNSDYTAINFFHPFISFEESPLPKTVEEYLRYKANSINFINNRNKRIMEWVKNKMIEVV